MHEQDFQVGLISLVKGFLFALQAEGRSARTYQCYRKLLKYLLEYAQAQAWPENIAMIDATKLRDERSQTDLPGDTPGGAFVALFKTSTGQEFLALYGHINSKQSVRTPTKLGFNYYRACSSVPQASVLAASPPTLASSTVSDWAIRLDKGTRAGIQF